MTIMSSNHDLFKMNDDEHTNTGIKRTTDVLQERINKLEEEIKKLNDKFNNLYEVFFKEDLTAGK